MAAHLPDSFFVFTLEAKAVIFKNRHARGTEGHCFLDYCPDTESRERFEQAFTRCFALHEDQHQVAVTVRIEEGHEVNLVIDLEWIGSERVICYATRYYDVGTLTPREQSILRLASDPHLSNGSIAEIFATTAANVRATVSRIKSKLNIHRREGLRMAAAQLGWRLGG